MAGLLGGYIVFGRSTDPAAYAVNQQIVLYVFARVVMALAKLAVAPSPRAATGPVALLGGKGDVVKGEVSKVGWPIFASLSWGAVMYLFRWHPESIQPSLRSSMTYLYVSHAALPERWYDWWN